MLKTQFKPQTLKGYTFFLPYYFKETMQKGTYQGFIDARGGMQYNISFHVYLNISSVVIFQKDIG